MKNPTTTPTEANLKPSRVFDPTYKPTKTYTQIWEEAGRPNNGMKVMAEREKLASQPKSSRR